MENIKFLLNTLCHYNDNFYSVELCSNRQLDVSSLSSINPLFYSITWHTNQSYTRNDDMENVPALSLASSLIAHGKNVLLHFPCRYFAKHDIFEILTIAKNIGVKNIFALQGDFIESKQSTKDSTDFTNAIHLVRYIKEKFENCFCVGVAAYPSCHPEAPSESTDILYLKEKIDAGADFIITQAIFEIAVFHTFYKNCREAGITVPIIPGIFVIKSYEGLMGMSNLCKLNVPENILKQVQSIKDNNELREFGIHQATDLVNNLLSDNMYQVSVVHIFSLNNIENVHLLYRRIIK